MTAESQHENAKRLHEETPHHPKSVGLTEQFYIAAAGCDRCDLQYDDRVDQPVRGSKLQMRPTEPGGQNSIFRQPVQNTIRADNRSVDGAGKNQYSHNDHENVKRKTE